MSQNPAQPPDWDAVDSLYDEARAAERAGDKLRAIALYRQLLDLDPQDHLGVALRLAPLAGGTPPKAPDAYVATLFDQVADRFDAILVDELGYGVPLLIADALDRLAVGPSVNWLDLGCGTGLCAMALEERTQNRTGVDLAPTMVEIADELELYQHLYVGEAVAFLQSDKADGPYDLVTAADVLPYVGDLAQLLEGLASRVEPGAILALSSEHLAEGGAPFAVGPHKRFAHGSSYLEESLLAHGWQVLLRDAITVRLEQDEPVAGELIIARRA